MSPEFGSYSCRCMRAFIRRIPDLAAEIVEPGPRALHVRINKTDHGINLHHQVAPKVLLADKVADGTGVVLEPDKGRQADPRCDVAGFAEAQR